MIVDSFLDKPKESLAATLNSPKRTTRRVRQQRRGGMRTRRLSATRELAKKLFGGQADNPLAELVFRRNPQHVAADAVCYGRPWT